MKIPKFLLLFSLALLLGSCSQNSSQKEIREAEGKKVTHDGSGQVAYLNTQNFIDYVFDFRSDTEWHYKSQLPCVIDFYADWCGPCKRLSPIMEDLAAEYKGKIQFYKINIDTEKELARYFNVVNIPSVMVCPVKGLPVMSEGLMPKEGYVQMISEVVYSAN